MGVTKKFEMTEADKQKILEACRPTPYIIVGGCAPSSPQENANAAWCELGRRMGFDGMTVRPSSEGDRFFTAESTAMDMHELAKRLDGRQYRNEMTLAEEDAAKADGLVVMFGASDDLIELRGAIHDEVGACDGGEVWLDEKGELVPEIEDSEEIEVLKKYGVFDVVKAKRDASNKIEGVWGGGDYSWTFKTDIPHATFEIKEDEEKYCLGIVFKAWW
jgi:hypothetical protein